MPLTIQKWPDSDADLHETSKRSGCLTSLPTDTSVKSFSFSSSQAASFIWSINLLPLENGFKYVIRKVYL